MRKLARKVAIVTPLLIVGVVLVLARNPRIPLSSSTIIQQASVRGWYGIVAIQLALGVNPDGPDRTPLIAAILFDHPDIAELVVSHGANLERQFASGEPDGPPLAWALTRKRTKIAKMLLRHGARADYRRQYGSSNDALQMAVELGDVELVKLLLTNGADPNGYLGSKHSPLQLAIMEGKDEIARALIRAGASNPRH